MPAEKTQSFCPCSRVLNMSGKGLNIQCGMFFLLDEKDFYFKEQHCPVHQLTFKVSCDK